jgi:hypothetical protein
MEPYEDAMPHVIEPISREDWEQRQVYAKFGLAIYCCQCLESQLVNYLALLRRIKTGRPMTGDEIDALFDRLFGGTFGRNLKEVRDLLGDQWAMAEELTSALNLRNQLVHHWMRDRALAQGTSRKRRAMVGELDEVIEQLETIDAKLTETTRRLQDRAGIPRSLIDREYEELRRIADSDEPTTSTT